MLKKTLLAAAVLGFAVNAQAFDLYEADGYVFGNIGSAYSKKPNASKHIDSIMTDEYFYSGRTKFEGNDFAFKLGAGVNLNELLSIEIQYADFGKRKYKVTTVEPATGKVNYDTWGLGLNLVAGTYVDDLETVRLYGKVGVNHMTTNVKLKQDIEFDDGSTSKKKRSVSPSLGLGVSYALTEELALTAEYDYFNKGAQFRYENDNERKKTSKNDIHMGSVGLRYSF